jgi:hypothetical protein
MIESRKTTFTLVTYPSLWLPKKDEISFLLLGCGNQWKHDLTTIAHDEWRSKNLSFFTIEEETISVDHFHWTWHHLQCVNYVIIHLDNAAPFDLVALGAAIEGKKKPIVIGNCITPEIDAILTLHGIIPYDSLDTLSNHFCALYEN